MAAPKLLRGLLRRAMLPAAVFLVRAAAGCQSELDCSLNGDCVDALCRCDPAWEGDQCERFATLPTPPGMDIKEENITTWGGQAVQHGGEFHMFASEYVGNCGITAWLTNSQTVRFVSATPKGPWKRKEVVVKGYSTCPSAAVTSNGTVVLWTMGGGGKSNPRLGPDAWGNRCEGGASPCGFAKHGCGPNAPAPKHPPPPGPSPPGSKGASCATFASASGYECAPHSCLSDGTKTPGRCGAGFCTGDKNDTVRAAEMRPVYRVLEGRRGPLRCRRAVPRLCPLQRELAGRQSAVLRARRGRADVAG